MELHILKSCATVKASMEAEECELTFGLSETAIHGDFVCFAGTAMLHLVSWAIAPTILLLDPK